RLIAGYVGKDAVGGKGLFIERARSDFFTLQNDLGGAEIFRKVRVVERLQIEQQVAGGRQAGYLRLVEQAAKDEVTVGEHMRVVGRHRAGRNQHGAAVHGDDA